MFIVSKVFVICHNVFPQQMLMCCSPCIAYMKIPYENIEEDRKLGLPHSRKETVNIKKKNMTHSKETNRKTETEMMGLAEKK